MRKKYLVWFDEVDKGDVGLVGGKGANLGEMTKAGFPVPYGFVISSHAYFYVLHHNDLSGRMKHIIDSCNFDNPKELHNAAKQIRDLFIDIEIPKDLVKNIVDYYHALPLIQEKINKKNATTQIAKHTKSIVNPALVAVRSSATAEDLPDASFAGQQESFLNVRGENHLLAKVKACWASLFTERAVYYRHTKNFDHMKVGLACVVQKMIQSEKSGIAFSINPVTNDKSTITIEAILGLGEYIVQGKVTPDHYEINKSNFTIDKKEIVNQKIQFIKRGVSNIEKKITNKEGNKQKLSDQQIINLAKIVAKIEKHYYFPQDLEWAIEDSAIYIVQSRPITTTKTNIDKKNSPSLTFSDFIHIAKGSPASPGFGIGKATVLTSPDDIHILAQGDVLIARQTNPDYVPAMKKASAIVTEVGGRTSHAAIVSRELGIPAVVGCDKIISLIKNHDYVLVNGSSGDIYSVNKKDFESTKSKIIKHSTVKSTTKKLKTLTKIYVNLAQTERALDVSKMHVDGVGLLRAEFIIADIGTHPKEIIRTRKQKEFIQILTKKLLDVVKPFSPRPVIYRATDFKSNEYLHLKGGIKYEPKEENPMIGFRGASRYIVWQDVFEMEIEAVKNVRRAGYKNLNLMIPFIRIPQELTKIKNILSKHNLANIPSFKLWIMVEVPSSVLLFEDFARIGIDGVSFGTNDLTMLILGVDRDSPEVAHLYDERNKAVQWAISHVVSIAKKYNITTSICGQAPSDYPEIVERLIKEGITSISCNIDALDRVREQVYLSESLLWQKSKK